MHNCASCFSSASRLAGWQFSWSPLFISVQTIYWISPFAFLKGACEWAWTCLWIYYLWSSLMGEKISKAWFNTVFGDKSPNSRCAASDADRGQHKARGEGLWLFSGRQNWAWGLHVSHVLFFIQYQTCMLQSSCFLWPALTIGIGIQ